MKEKSINKIIKKTKSCAKYEELYVNFFPKKSDLPPIPKKISRNTIPVNSMILRERSSHSQELFQSLKTFSISNLPHFPKKIYRNYSVTAIKESKDALNNKSLSRFNNDIFNNNSFKNLIYDEKDIFNKFSHYEDLIKDKVEFFQKNKNLNLTDNLRKILSSQGKTFEIKIQSLEVKFINKNKSKEINFFFPFSLLPVFYSRSIEAFKILLAKIVTFDLSYESIKLDESQIYSLLSSEIHIQKKFLSTNVYRFSWVAPKDNNFLVEVILPMITFKELHSNILIEKFIDFEFLFYLYENNFLFWDFYTMNYLFSYKKFREIIKKIFSKVYLVRKRNLVNNAFENLKFSIGETKVKEYSMNDNHFSFILTSDDNINYLCKVFSASIFAILNRKSPITERISFNFSQTQRIYLVKNKVNDNIELVLQRFLDLKEKKIIFNYEEFEVCSSKTFREIYKNEKAQSIQKRLFLMQLQKMHVITSSIEERGKLYSYSAIDIELDLFLKINNTNIIEWGNIICKNLHTSLFNQNCNSSFLFVQKPTVPRRSSIFSPHKRKKLI